MPSVTYAPISRKLVFIMSSLLWTLIYSFGPLDSIFLPPSVYAMLSSGCSKLFKGTLGVMVYVKLLVAPAGMESKEPEISPSVLNNCSAHSESETETSEASLQRHDEYETGPLYSNCSQLPKKNRPTHTCFQRCKLQQLLSKGLLPSLSDH